MRLSNDRDQSLIRSVVSGAALNLLSFIPSLGTREVFTFGPGVAMPSRMRFRGLPPELRPTSEVIGNTSSDAGNSISRDLLTSVIEQLAQRQHEPSRRRRRIPRLQFAARCRTVAAGGAGYAGAGPALAAR